MNHLNFVKFNILRVTPQHSQHKVVQVWYRLVLVLEVHIQKVLPPHHIKTSLKLSHFKLAQFVKMSNIIYAHTYLLSKRCGLGDLKCLKKITVSDKIRFIDKHASVEI